MAFDQLAIANEIRDADAQAHEAQTGVESPSLRDCGCPPDGPCVCGPRLRIFDPMGRLLMSPVYY